MKILDIITESHNRCPHCGGPLVSESELMEKKDACYYKIKSSAKVWPSAYASGRLVQCRKKGAANYGNKSESMAEGIAETLQQQVRAAITKGMEKWDQNGLATYQSQPAKRHYFASSDWASGQLEGINSIDPDGTVVIELNDTTTAGLVKKLAALGGMPGVKTRQLKMTFDPAKANANGVTQGDVAEGENWSKHNNKRAGGMSKKSVSVYRREHPGSKIQTAVTTKPSKLKKGSKAAKRRASFCARMRGMKKHRTSAKTAHDPNSNINKSLRRWHCESIEELHELVMLAEQFIRNNKK